MRLPKNRGRVVTDREIRGTGSTLKSRWDFYYKASGLDKASIIQQTSMKSAFYFGAFEMFSLMVSPKTDEEAEICLQNLVAEINEHTAKSVEEALRLLAEEGGMMMGKPS